MNFGLFFALLLNLNGQVCEDPLSAIQRLEAVTTARLTSEYSEAGQRYDACLDRLVGSEGRDLLIGELLKMRPIVGEGIFRQWSEWVERDPALVITEIRGYWIQQDPTPITNYNERFFEHWMRLGEARTRYRSGGGGTGLGRGADDGGSAGDGRTPSERQRAADDRFDLFLRYGDPDQIKQVTFTLDADLLPAWFPDRFWKGTVASGATGEMGGGDQGRSRSEVADPNLGSGDPIHNPILDPTGAAQRMSSGERDASSLGAVRSPFDLLLQTTPSLRMEMWTYESLGGRTLPVSFFFQRDAVDGSVRQMNSLDDLIPEALFHSRRDDPTIAAAALLLQVLILKQAAPLSPFLDGALNEIAEQLVEGGMLDPASDAQNIRSKMRTAFSEWYSTLPQEASALDEISSSLPMDVVQYRYLDEENEPRMMVSIESPGNPESGIEAPVYRHTLQLFDKRWQPVFTSVRNISIQTQPDIRSVTVFDVSQEEAAYQVASSLFWSSQDDSGTPVLDYFGEGFEGVDGILLGNVTTIVPEALSTDPSALEMADLVLGSEPALEDPLPGPIAFTISNSRRIRQDQILYLHLQLYHLGLASTGYTDFEFTYRILPVGTEGVNIDEGRFSLTLEFESAEPRFTETLEIRTASLEPGVYELQADVVDEVTGQNLQRSVRFEVIPAAQR